MSDDPTPGAVLGGAGGPSDATRGLCDQACNLIAGNDEAGDQFQVSGPSSAAPAPSLQGNVIGRSSTGGPLPNQGPGVAIDTTREQPDFSSPGASSGSFGLIGAAADDGNLIADNSGAAIAMANVAPHVDGAAAPTIEGNSITGNATGIVYGPGTDAPGPPLVSRVTLGSGGQVTLAGTVPFHSSGATSSVAARIDVYADTSCEPGPQGKVPLGSVKVNLLSSAWTFTASGIASSLRYFTATSTVDGSTSTFSDCAAGSS